MFVDVVALSLHLRTPELHFRFYLFEGTGLHASPSGDSQNQDQCAKASWTVMVPSHWTGREPETGLSCES